MTTQTENLTTVKFGQPGDITVGANVTTPRVPLICQPHHLQDCFGRQRIDQLVISSGQMVLWCLTSYPQVYVRPHRQHDLTDTLESRTR